MGVISLVHTCPSISVSLGSGQVHKLADIKLHFNALLTPKLEEKVTVWDLLRDTVLASNVEML
jgi:hypothetical protein